MIFEGLPACPRCLPLTIGGQVWVEMLMPLEPGALAPLARDGSGKCCRDCGAADSLVQPGMDFLMARVAVGNDRIEALRLPGARMGLVMAGRMRDSEPGDLNRQIAWLDSLGFFQDANEDEDDLS